MNSLPNRADGRLSGFQQMKPDAEEFQMMTKHNKAEEFKPVGKP